MIDGLIDCLVFILLLFCFVFFCFSCNYFSQGEIITLGSVGGPNIIRDVVVGMVETQLFFFLGTKQPGSVKFGIS